MWNWLPAFRAVAETEHIQQAARALHTSPSAVSRTIRLLEDALGQALFHRAARGLRLTGAGRDLLEAVREAMDRVEAGLHGDRAGTVRICGTAPVTLLFLGAALTRLRASHPDVVPSVERHEPGACVQAILAGLLDVAFVHAAATHPQLSCVRAGSFTNGVYCGPGHPLWGARPRLAELLAFRFAVPVAEDGGVAACDGWPAELPRRAGALVVDVATAAVMASRGDLLAVLPDALARAGGALWRVPLEIVPSTTVHALRRTAAGRAAVSDLVVAAVVAAMRDADAEVNDDHDSNRAAQSL